MQDHGMTSVKRQGYGEAMAAGVSVWLVYGILECVFSVILPYLLNPKYNFVPVHWGFQASLLVAYAIVGIVAGLIVAAAVSWNKRWREKRTAIISASATCSVIAALCANAAVGSPGRLIYTAAVMAMGAALFLAVSWNVHLNGRNRFFRIFANHWTALAVLMGMFWINFELAGDHGIPAKVGFFTAYVLGIALVGFAVYEMANAASLPALVKGRIKPLVLLTSCAILVLGAAALLKQQPIVAGRAAKTAPPSVSGMPNIIIIIMDTVRADHLSVYGYERDTTPNLRELAKQAIVYTQAIAPGDMTLTSHASLFTGMYAIHHGAYPDFPEYPAGRSMIKSAATLAEILTQKGYLAMAVVSNAGLVTKSFGFDRGFEYFDQRFRPRFLERQSSRHYLKDVLRGSIASFSVPREWELKWRRAEDINSEVFRLLDEHKGEPKPFFLFINYMDAHRPYVPPPPYDSLYPGKNLMKMSQTDFGILRDDVLWGKREVTERERQYLVSQYDAGIAYLDAKIGELIRYLKEHGIYDNSFLIITSDHGEAFGERNMLEHGCGVYKDQVHIPLIIVEPNFNDARVVERFVSLVDLFPTVLDFARAENSQPQKIAGQSLKKMKDGGAGWVATESYPMFDAPKMRRIERAIISGSFKFITSTKGKKELYDLTKDPGEKENLYCAADDISQGLESTMNQWIKTAPPKSSLSRNVDKNALENLKFLGYIK